MAELLRRASALEGQPLRSLGADATGPALRRKGKVGSLIELALGADAGSFSGPDFSGLGVELKTIPLDDQGRARESTFVCSLALRDAQELDFEASPLFAKLRCVLWVPILDGPDERRVGRPLLWRPSPAQQAVLRADFDDLMGMIAIGNVEALTARLGAWLQVRPKAAHGGVRTRALNHEGEPVWTMPRGFYLRARFTSALLQDPATLLGTE